MKSGRNADTERQPPGDQRTRTSSRHRWAVVLAAGEGARLASLTREAQGIAVVSAVYERLPTLDFSRDVLQGAEEQLCVLRVPRCGWSDLGTPRRLAACLERLPAHSESGTDGPVSDAVNLAAERGRVRLLGEESIRERRFSSDIGASPKGSP